MIKINKKFYLSSFIILPIFFAVILLVASWLELDIDDALFLGLLPILIIYIIGLVFHYKVWKAIQDGYASTSPGKAVGFLFIPIYNIYWLFRSLDGFARDFNVYIARHQIDTKDLPERFYFFQCILIILMLFLGNFESEWVFYTFLVVTGWVYINTVVIINKSANAVNAIYEGKTSLKGSED